MKRILLLSLILCFAISGCATTGADVKSPVHLALEAKVELTTDVPEGVGKAPGAFTKQTAFVSLAALIYSVAVSPDGRYVASGLDDDTVIIWDLSVGKCIHILKGHKGWVVSLAFSTDGKQLVSGGSDGTVKTWDIAKGISVKSYNTFAKKVSAVAFSPDQHYILSGNDNQQIMIWDATTDKQVMAFKTGEVTNAWRTVMPFAFSPDGRYVLATNDNGALILWESLSGKLLKYFSGHSGEVTALAFSPDGASALAGTSGGKLELLDVASGRVVRKFDGHDSLIRSCGFSHDSRYVLSGSHDNTARLWDVSSGAQLVAVTQPKEVKAVAMTPDQRLIVTGSSDGTTRIWDRGTVQEIIKMVKLVKYVPPMFIIADQPAKEQEFKPLKDAWVVMTPDGYYTGSTSALDNIWVKKGISVYNIDQFYDVFYRPDIIIARIRGEYTSDMIRINMDDALNNPPPEVDISSVPRSTSKETVKVEYEVTSEGGGIGEIRVFHNGKLIHSDGYYRAFVKKTQDKVTLESLNGKAVYQSMRGIAIKGTKTDGPVASQDKGNAYKGEGTAETTPGANGTKMASSIVSKDKGNSYKGEVMVEATPGENEVSIAAFNRDNTVQSRMETATFKSTLPPREPHLYILAVGINKYRDEGINLSFAAKDARDFIKKLVLQGEGIYRRQNIHSVVLLDEQASKKNIVDKIDEIAVKVKPTDSMVIFVAGHGILHQSQYYLITHDYNGDIGEGVMIGSGEIMEMSKKIKSLNQLFIFDTCHAGGVDWIISGLYDARMSALARQMGLHVYASASSMQQARDGYRGNGLFTHTLIDGLANNKTVDKNTDRKVSMEELGEYTQYETTELSRQSGQLQVPMIINFGHDYPVYELR
jgi:WD40 repeat protein